MEQIYARRRIVYLVALTPSIPALALIWWSQAHIDPFVRFAYPFLFVYLAWAWVTLLLHRERLASIEVTTFWVVALFWPAMMIVNLLTIRDPALAWNSLSPTVFLGFVTIAIMAYLFFDNRIGVIVSICLLVFSTLVGLARFLPLALAGDGTILVDLLRYELFFGVIIVFLYVLAKSKDDHARAQSLAQAMTIIAYEDALTGLPNRRWLNEELERHQHISARYGRRHGLILFDLDHFKAVNDRFGHAVGDQVLKEVATLVPPLIRAGEIFGRWGGEEFAIVTLDGGGDASRMLAERIRWAIEAHTFTHDLTLTASFGVAINEPGLSAKTLFERADGGLYVAKQAGRNRVSVYDNDAPDTLSDG
jgi:diguanylate cyclase (GGDEF)-like protein